MVDMCVCVCVCMVGGGGGGGEENHWIVQLVGEDRNGLLPSGPSGFP